MKPRAVANRIVGTMKPKETKTEGGIFLPEARKTHTATSGEAAEIKVISVGPEVREIKVGMTVLADPLRVETFTLNGKEYVSLEETWFNWKSNTGALFGVYHEE